MRKLSHLLCLCGLLLAYTPVFLTPACSTAITVNSVAARLEIVAKRATIVVAAKSPEDVPKLRQAVAGLKSIEASGTATVDSIVQALQAAGIDELKSADAGLIIDAGRLVFYDFTDASSTKLDTNLLPIATAIRKGIEEGLGS